MIAIDTTKKEGPRAVGYMGVGTLFENEGNVYIVTVEGTPETCPQALCLRPGDCAPTMSAFSPKFLVDVIPPDQYVLTFRRV